MKMIIHYQLNTEGYIQHTTLINVNYIKTIQHNPVNEKLIIQIEKEGISKHLIFDNVKDPLEFLQTNPIEIQCRSFLKSKSI